jgi:hypothetical protein
MPNLESASDGACTSGHSCGHCEFHTTSNAEAAASVASCMVARIVGALFVCLSVVES